MIRLIGCTDRSDSACFRYTRGGGEHGRPAQAVPDQQLRCAETLTHKVCGCNQVGNIGGEIRVRKVAAAATEPGEIESQHRNALRCKFTADVSRRKAVLRARETVREQRVSARGADRTIQACGKRLSACAAETKLISQDQSPMPWPRQPRTLGRTSRTGRSAGA